MAAVKALLIVCLTILACPAFGQTAQTARARNGMVVSSEPHASDAGVRVLRQGGNAIDASVAVALALAVTHPAAGNIGGGGFMLVHLANGYAGFIDFRERAPLASARNMYLDSAGQPTRDSSIGWRAAGVPGTVRGLELAHKRYGRLPWKLLAAPAIELAEQGFPLGGSQAKSLNGSTLLAMFPESRRIFQKDGQPWSEGEVFRQPELAATLKRIASSGSADFYEGQTARALAASMARNGGLITLEDLRQYVAVERRPLTGTHRGYTVLTSPPPSSGGVGILQMLAVLSATSLPKAGPGSPLSIHMAAEAMRRFFAERSEHLGDPDFARLPVAGLLDPGHIAALRDSINPARATPSDSLRAGAPLYEPPETTHLSVVDADGNAVSLTYTINGAFGSGVTVPGLGFLLNNEMDDFSAKPGSPNTAGLVQGEVNAIQPGKRPLSSMAPTILLRDGKPFLVLGSPGSGRIITAVLQVILNILDFGMPLEKAVAYPRFHHQWKPDRLFLEPGFPEGTQKKLESLGHSVEITRAVGEVEAILLRDGWIEGVADPRTPGKAGGY